MPLPAYNENLNLVFIVGCQRSGTTLTGQILGGHPNAVLIDENDGLYDFSPKMFDEGCLSFELLSEILEKANGKYKDEFCRFELSQDGELRLARNVTHIVFKAPNLTYFPEEISDLAQPVHILGLVRNPLSVVASMQRLTSVPMIKNQIRWMKMAPKVASEFAASLQLLEDSSASDHVKRAEIWRVKTLLMSGYGKYNLTPHIVRYEDIIANSEAVIAGLLSSVNLPDADVVSSYNQEMIGFGPGGTDRTRAIDGASLQSWKHSLSATDARDVLVIAGELLHKYDYA